MKKRMLALVLALVMLVSVLPVALAEDAKTITVEGGGTAIQNAINTIAGETDKTGWTILVKEGTYNRFTILSDMNGLTVKAMDGAAVVIGVLDGSEAPAQISGAFPETCGISIRNANDVTLDGLTIRSGSKVTSPWYASAVSNYSESGVKGNNFTIQNCVFDANGYDSAHAVFVNTGTTKFTVKNCSFDGYYEAISMYGDGTLMEGASVTGNTFTNCSFALHGYYGGTGEAGVLRFADNAVTGTKERRCKIVIQDQYNGGSIKADISGNTFENALVGLVNLREAGETVSDVLKSNTMGVNSFYVEAVEPGTIEFCTQYHAPDGAKGHWVFTGIEDIGNSDYNPAGTVEYIKKLIEAANEAGWTTLTITGIPDGELIKTFTWFKDAIYWETDESTEPADYILPALWLNTKDHYSYLIGYADGTVKPEGKITRAEVATIFFRLLTDDARAKFWMSTNNYTDVPAGKWYNNAISTLSNMGVIGGYADGTFKPDAPISRAEFAKIAVSFSNVADLSFRGYFADVKESDWFSGFVAAAKDAGLIEGYNDGTFKPEKAITRAEVCTIVNRTLGRKPSASHMKISDRIDWPDVSVTDWYYEAIMEATNSHTYQMGQRVETWNDKLPQRDWALLETGWANAYTGNGGEVN